MLAIYNSATICGYEQPFQCSLRLQPHLREVSFVTFKEFLLWKAFRSWLKAETGMSWLGFGLSGEERLEGRCVTCLSSSLIWQTKLRNTIVRKELSSSNFCYIFLNRFQQCCRLLVISFRYTESSRRNGKCVERNSSALRNDSRLRSTKA